jgi:hypothetical protein
LEKKMKTWLNWKVLAVLGAAGAGIYLVASNLVAAALPFLLWAACPLSMLLMMEVMQGGQGEAHGQQAPQEDAAGLTREEQIARLRTQQERLADQISALERDEPRPVNDGKER